MKKIKFRGWVHFGVFVLFSVCTVLCFVGLFYNPFHLVTCGMSAGMTVLSYRSW